MGTRINTIMQTCFFALSGVLPRDEAIEQIKYSIKKTYGKKGEDVVRRTSRRWTTPWQPVRGTRARPGDHRAGLKCPPVHRRRTRTVRQGNPGQDLRRPGRSLPVSALPCDGTFPTATAQYEKRNLALEIPVWDEKTCIQCGKCVAVCPHATIRIKVYDTALLGNAPATFKVLRGAVAGMEGMKFTIQVAPEDCTGCVLCVDVCPAKNKSEPSSRRSTCARRPLAPGRARELGFLPAPPGSGPAQGARSANCASSRSCAVVRVQRRLRRLRRNPVSQAADAVVRRPGY
jgi:pyruvate-ferredoxin/flavodoxin oxidoreductase